MKFILFSSVIVLGISSLCSAMPTDTRARYEQEDKELGKLYADLIGRLKKDQPAAVKSLRSSERKWIAFRDAECEFQEQTVERTDIYAAECLEKLTLQRIETLKGILERLNDK